LQPEEDNAAVVNCWVMTTGTVLCVDARFSDWFGKAHLDIVGKSVTTLAVEQDRISEYVAPPMLVTQLFGCLCDLLVLSVCSSPSASVRCPTTCSVHKDVRKFLWAVAKQGQLPP
jgi:hypothetical protein